MIVNNLCFDPDQFLKLLEGLEEGENLYFVDILDGVKFMIWIGETKKDYKIIRSARGELETMKLLKGFCPFFSGKFL